MRYDFSDELKKVLAKLSKKDPESYKAVKNKIEEIVNSNPEHYKPLRFDLKNKKRMHIRKSFVLIFEYDQFTDTLWFLDYDHHDNVYNKY